MAKCPSAASDNLDVARYACDYLSRKRISLSPLSANKDSPLEKQDSSGHFTWILSKKVLQYFFSCSIIKGSSSQISILVAIIIIPIVIMLLFSRFEILYQIFLPNILIVPYSPLFILMGICWYFAKDKTGCYFGSFFFSFPYGHTVISSF